MQIISIVLFSNGADCPEHLCMSYKKTKVSLTRSSSVKEIVGLQPRITNACISACVAGLRVLFFFSPPQGANFGGLILMFKACKRDQNLSLKTNSTSRKEFHMSLSHLWEEIRQRSQLFRKFTVSLDGTQRPWQNSTWVIAFCSPQGPEDPTTCRIYCHFLPLNVLRSSFVLFKQMLCFTCHSPMLWNQGEQDIRHHGYHF